MLPKSVGETSKAEWSGVSDIPYLYPFGFFLIYLSENIPERV
jgi:hypothetical protein